ncbi:MAG TPA: polysaccharide deacetylase family protein, partial [Paludibacteraceae bacterium]|nr:polysaccharide deacetylase family protein [Paludibacteraceae bacterium]
RPPYGKMKRSQQRALNKKYELILWDVITYDYNTKLSPQKVFNNVKHYTRNGSIILFHDSIKARNNVLAVLPLAIEFWNKKGYNFGVI